MRIGDFTRKDREPAREASREGGPGKGQPVQRFWDSPDADLEAGQEKLRSAVEWGVYRRFSGNGASGKVLNLKPACGEGFFGGPGQPPQVTTYPGVSDPLAWLQGQAPGSFDNLFALDFREGQGGACGVLADLARPLRKGGSLFLNFFSAEHFALAESLPALPGRTPVRERAAFPATLTAPSEVREAAARNGLAVTRIIPYSSCYGNSLWLELMDSRFRWERILDWLSSDAKLFEFALFLEETLVSALGPACAPRFAAVLEKTGGAPSRPEAPREAPGTLFDRLGLPQSDLQASLSAHLRDIRNRVFLQHIWRLAHFHLREGVCPGWRGMLPAAIEKEYASWLAQESLDARGMAAVDGWHAIPEVDAALRHRGTALGAGLQYEQLRRMLSEVFGCFRKAGG